MAQGLTARRPGRSRRSAALAVAGLLAGLGGAACGSGAPVSVGGTTSVPPSEASGAYGYVTAGPSCPVERVGQPCPPRPVSARVQARDAAGSTAASTTTDTQGHYALRLLPGTYTLTVVTSAGWPRCPNTPVTVSAGAPSRADISCDTGIR